MLIVAVSRVLVVPVYLTQLGTMGLDVATMALLQRVSFGFMILALAAGTPIIAGAMLRGFRHA